jgi:hypothetical protein
VRDSAGLKNQPEVCCGCAGGIHLFVCLLLFKQGPPLKAIGACFLNGLPLLLGMARHLFMMGWTCLLLAHLQIQGGTCSPDVADEEQP